MLDIINFLLQLVWGQTIECSLRSRLHWIQRTSFIRNVICLKKESHSHTLCSLWEFKYLMCENVELYFKPMYWVWLSKLLLLHISSLNLFFRNPFDDLFPMSTAITGNITETFHVIVNFSLGFIILNWYTVAEPPPTLCLSKSLM